MLEGIWIHAFDSERDRPLLTFGPLYPRLRRLQMPLCSRICRDLDSERFPVLRRVETKLCFVASSFNLSGLSTKGGVYLLLSGPLVDIKLPDEPLRSLTLHSSHIREMIAGDALCKALLSIKDLCLEHCTPADLVMCHQKTTGIPPVEGQPIVFPHLQRLELLGDDYSTNMSLFNFPALRHLKLCKSNTVLRCENFQSLESFECFKCNITLSGEFPELRSLNMVTGSIGVESKFTAPMLQEMTFESVSGVNILEVGRATFPSLQAVSITKAIAYSNRVEEKHIPRLVANAELDRSPRIVLRMDLDVAEAFGKQSPGGMPGWIAFSTNCTLPDYDGFD